MKPIRKIWVENTASSCLSALFSGCGTSKNLPNRQIIAPVPDLFKKICIDKGVNNNGCMEFKRSSGFDL